MKLHLPTPLRAALMATFAAILTLGSAATAATYSNLREVSIDADNHVYYNGNGTFYVQSAQDTTLDVTINLAQFRSYQSSNDYTGFTPFIGWTFANGISDGIADVSTKNNASSYVGLTGYYGSNKYALSGNGQSSLTLETLQSYATDDVVTVTVRNNITSGVSLTLGSGSNAVTYQNTGLKFSNQNTSTTSYSVNTQYVTSVKINTASTLDTDSFELPPDYSQPFHSDRWDAGDKTSLGRVLFVGDSITHGVSDQTWRWQIFKTMVDNGIENEIAGPRSDYDTRFANATSDRGMSSYGGEEFNNVHLAQSSGRTHNIIAGSNAGVSGVNYGGWSTSKTAAAYNADTMVCLMGTNDLLSDGGDYVSKFAKLLGGTVSYDDATKHYTWEHNASNSWGEWGTMGTIMGDLMKDEGDTMYVMSIPTWGIRNDLKYGPNGNVDIETAHHGVQEYNGMLKQWTEQYSAATGKKVKYVEVNRGLVDLTDSVSFKGYTSFFRGSGDQLHPTEQGSLIIAGNLAQGMGLAGRTAGLTRSQVGHEEHGWLNAAQSINLAAGQTQKAISDAFTIEGGYTIDFSAVFGDGSANGWKGMDSALSVAIGDGTNGGTLKLSEGYISWGDTVLFCQDNHLTNNDSLRVAYHQGSAENNIGSGYYVWLGDMLIGQALTASDSSLNGVTLTSTGGNAVISGLSYVNTAYAPSTTLTTALDNGLSHVTPPSSDVILTPMPSGDRNMTVEPTTIGGTPLTQQFAVTANNGQSSVNLTGNATNWNGAVNSAGHKGDVNVEVVGNAATASLFGVVQGTVAKSDAEGDTGSVKMVLSNSVVVGKQKFGANWDSGNTEQNAVAIAGSFQSVIDGTFALELNQATVGGDIVMGVVNALNRGSVGATELTMNAGAVVNGNIYGGSYDSHGEVQGNAEITINGGTVNGNVEGGGKTGGVAGGNGTIKGDASIAINGGVITGDVTIGGGTIEGKSTVTVTGNKASIGGNITVAGENGKVILKDVSDSGYSDGFDQYGKKNNGEEGKTISATNLELNNYTAQEVHAKLEGEHLVVKGNSMTTVSNLVLTACDITVEGGSTLILSGTQTYGHTATYSGALTIAQGTTFSVENPTELQESERPGKYTSGANGFAYSGRIWNVLTPENPAVDKLLDTDGSELGLVTNLTLKGKGVLEGAFFVYKPGSGVLNAYENIVTTTCYITEGVLTYGRQTGAYGATESLQLSGGATLAMADNLADGVTITSTGGVVNLADNVTLAASGLTASGATKLSGVGTFALADNSTTLPTNISLDDDWYGVIRLSKSANGALALNNASSKLANAHSKVELNGVNAWLTPTAAIRTNLDTNLVLTDKEDGTVAFNFTAASGYEYDFKGSVEGDGTLKFSNGNNNSNTLSFEGDISGWYGEFINDNTHASATKAATGLILKGAATELNAAIRNNTTGQLNLSLGTITNGATGYTFTNEVNVSSLSASGKTVILAAADDITPGGKLSVSGAAAIGTLTMEQNTSASFGGELTIDSLNLEGGNSVHLGENATLNAASVHAAAGTSSSLSGAGTIQLQAKALPGLVLADDWTGRVFLHDTTIADGGSYWMNALSKSGSVLELSGFTGYDSSWAYNDNTANICLTDTASGGAAWTFNAPTSYTTYDLSASGNWSGTGTFKADGTNKLKYSFSGDMSEWTGTFDYNVVDSTLTLKENATVLNAAIHRTGGTMALDLSGNTTTTLNNTVEVASLSAAGKNVILGSHGEGETATHGALSVSGDAAIGTLTVNGGCSASFAGTTSITDIKVDDTAQLSFGSGSTVTTNTLGLINNGGSATANVIIDLTNNTVLKIAGANDSVVFAAHGERVNIEAGSALNIVSKGVTVESIDGETSAAFYTPVGHATSGRYTYKQNSYGFTVENAKMTLNNTGATTLNNVLKNTDVVNEGTGKLTIDQTSTKAGEQNTLHGIHAKNGAVTLLDANTSAATLTNIKAEGGDVTLEGLQTAVVANLNDLYIGDERTVSLYQGTTAAGVEGVITVNGTLTAGEGSTLNADLVLGTNAKLDFASEGLHMGSTLTLQSGSTITLGDRLIEYANTLIRSESVTLFTGVDALTIGGGAYDSTQTYSAADYFDLTGFNYGAEHYAVTYDSASGTVSLFMATPEPATSTLSLLALAALAARRKRK